MKSLSAEQMTVTMHYQLSLEQSDGRFDLEHAANGGDSDDLYGAPGHTRFGAGTSPNSHWWDGTDSDLEIVSVSAPGSTMTVATGPGAALVVANFAYNAGGWRTDMHPRFMADTTADGRADIIGFGDAGVWVYRW